jgi:hypothetical protein
MRWFILPIGYGKKILMSIYICIRGVGRPYKSDQLDQIISSLYGSIGVE